MAGREQACGHTAGKHQNLVTSCLQLCVHGVGVGGSRLPPARPQTPPLTPLDKWSPCTRTFMVLSLVLRPSTPPLRHPHLLA